MQRQVKTVTEIVNAQNDGSKGQQRQAWQKPVITRIATDNTESKMPTFEETAVSYGQAGLSSP